MNSAKECCVSCWEIQQMNEVRNARDSINLVKCYWIILTLRPTRPTDEMNEIYPQSKIVLLKELTHKASKPDNVFIWLIILPVIVRPIPNMRYLHLKLDCRMDMSCDMDEPWRYKLIESYCCWKCWIAVMLHE